MTIAEQLKDIVDSGIHEDAHGVTASMQALYRQMESLGYTEKQGYTLASTDSTTQLPNRRMNNGFSF